MAIVNSYQTAEYGKFIQLDNSSYPAVSVTRIGYYDSSSAFSGNTGSPTYSAIDVYPKYAVLTYSVNGSGGGGGSIDLTATNLKIDTANTLLNAITAKETTISIDTSAINLNTDEIEDLIKKTNTLLNSVTAKLNNQLGQSGFNFIVGGQTAATGPYTTVQIASAARISAISVGASTIGQLTALELPTGFTFYGLISSLTLQYGAAFVYKQ